MDFKTLIKTLHLNHGANHLKYAMIGNQDLSKIPHSNATLLVPYLTFNSSEPPSTNTVKAQDNKKEDLLQSHKPPSNTEGSELSRFKVSLLYSTILGFMFTLPSVIAVVYLPIIYALLLILVPLGSMLGYRFGKSPVNKNSRLFQSITSYLTGFIIIIWCWNYYAKVHAYTFFYYLFEVDNLIPFIFDLVVGSFMITLGLLLSRKILPIS